MAKFDDLKKAVQTTELAAEVQAQNWFARNKAPLIVGGLALLIGFILGKVF